MYNLKKWKPRKDSTYSDRKKASNSHSPSPAKSKSAKTSSFFFELKEGTVNRREKKDKKHLEGYGICIFSSLTDRSSTYINEYKTFLRGIRFFYFWWWVGNLAPVSFSPLHFFLLSFPLFYVSIHIFPVQLLYYYLCTVYVFFFSCWAATRFICCFWFFCSDFYMKRRKRRGMEGERISSDQKCHTRCISNLALLLLLLVLYQQ